MLNNFVTLGGTSTLITSIKETIKLQVDSLLSPITNEINQAITNIITPFLTDVLQPMINNLNDYLSENKVGAGIGGIIGGVASLFLPGGPILVAIGAIVGSIVEDLLGGDIEIGGYTFENFGVWNARTGGNIWEYYDYLKGVIGGGAAAATTPPRSDTPFGGRLGGPKLDF